MKHFVTSFFRDSALMVLAVLVSGILPALVQGYAWIDMAMKADSIDSIGAVLVDAPPCHICDAAREMRESSPADDEAPLPLNKTDVLKSVSMFETIAGFLSASSMKQEFMFPLPSDSRLPRNLKFGPDSPPPRVTA